MILLTHIQLHIGIEDYYSSLDYVERLSYLVLLEYYLTLMVDPDCEVLEEIT